MHPLIARVEENIRRHSMIADGEAVLVAVSGGVDSMVLLNVLHGLSKEHRWKLAVAHFNHRLRGAAATRDERFVESAAQELQLPCESAGKDVRAFARDYKLSIESAARELRHAFLAERARTLGIRKIALAHHADDQVELFLLRMLRGAGSRGLSGMRVCSASPADPKLSLVRPLLDVRKTDLVAFAREHRIPFRTDATNRSIEPLRNRIRHKLLPLLRRDYQPALDSLVLREAELLAIENDYLDGLAKRWLRARRPRFAALHVALQRRVLQIQLEGRGIEFHFCHLENLRSRAGLWITLPFGEQCLRSASGEIEVRARPASIVKFPAGELVLDLSREPSVVRWNGLNLECGIQPCGHLPKRRLAQLEFFDAGEVGTEIRLRHWRPGDRFQPIGMRAPAKLQDLFVNQKIPRIRRHRLVIATTEAGEIFWVEGLRIGEQFKVTARTRRRLRWKWRREQVAAVKAGC